MEDKEIKLTQEDLDSINKDIEEAQKTLEGKGSSESETAPEPSVDTKTLKEELTAQILAELEAKEKRKLDEQKAITEKQRAEDQKNALEKQLAALKSKIDEMQESKGVVNVKSPFLNEKESFEDLMSNKEKVKSIDDASREQFFKQRG